jgi:hypothetical protein
MALRPFFERVVTRVREARVSLAEFSSEAIPGSLSSGAPGVAFFLHEAARLTGDDGLLDPARRWCAAGREWARRATRADWKDLPRGFLIGESGLAYVEALLCARDGDRKGVLTAVERMEQASDRMDDLRAGFRSNDLLGGGGGVLCGALDLDARLPPGPEHDAAREVLKRVRERAAAALEAAPREIGPSDPLGIAHGLAGDLWALIAVRNPGDETVRTRLRKLAAVRQLDEEGLVYWLPSRSSTDHKLLGTWCHGMAGHSLLWCEITRRTRNKESAEIARLAAEACSIMGGLNPTLCCGLAGQTVALQRYADLSGDSRFARRAYDRLVRAIRIVESGVEESPFGLWKGTLGVALVALSRLHGERSFPCIERLAGAPKYRSPQALV